MPDRELMAAAGVVVANDSGLKHIAGAVGVSTIMLFGPTPDRALGRLPTNVKVLRAGLRCEPYWFTRRFCASDGRIDYLAQQDIDKVVEVVCRSLGNPAAQLRSA